MRFLGLAHGIGYGDRLASIQVPCKLRRRARSSAELPVWRDNGWPSSLLNSKQPATPLNNLDRRLLQLSLRLRVSERKIPSSYTTVKGLKGYFGKPRCPPHLPRHNPISRLHPWPVHWSLLFLIPGISLGRWIYIAGRHCGPGSSDSSDRDVQKMPQLYFALTCVVPKRPLLRLWMLKYTCSWVTTRI